MVPCKKSQMVRLTFSRIKDNVFPALSTFPVKLICCIAFGSASSTCYLLKSIVIKL